MKGKSRVEDDVRPSADKCKCSQSKLAITEQQSGMADGQISEQCVVSPHTATAVTARGGTGIGCSGSSPGTNGLGYEIQLEVKGGCGPKTGVGLADLQLDCAREERSVGPF